MDAVELWRRMDPIQYGKVLVVDDEPDIVRLVKTCLEREGFEVFVAQDGVTALQSVATTNTRCRAIKASVRAGAASTCAFTVGMRSRLFRHAVHRLNTISEA